jgi:S-adenosyl-L-methionine hydrolase (adenosine-forming)
VRRAVEVTSDEVIEYPIADSFRARDTLCPTAAHLAAGTPLEQLGAEIDPATLAGLTVSEPEVEPGKIRRTVLDFNRFGNVQLNVREAELTTAGLDEAPVLSIEAVSGSADARRGRTYADFEAGAYGVIFDPRGWLMTVRANPGSALEGLGLALGDPVWISGPGSGAAQ